MHYLDLKYVNQLSIHLKNFSRKSNRLVNFSCPLCGDSEKNKRKARGYIFEGKGQKAAFFCHNCGKGMSLQNLLKIVNPGLFKEYVFENLQDQNKTPGNHNKKPANFKSDAFSLLPDLSQLPKNHPGVKFAVGRKLPLDKFNDLYYTGKFKAFTNKMIPNKFKAITDEPRIIIPFRTSNKDIFGFQGRSLNGKEPRYIAIILNDRYPNVYGLDTVNFNKKFYMCEGPFDSMFLENAIACGGSELKNTFMQLDCNKSNGVLIFDNEPRSSIIVGKMQGCLDLGYNVCIWPERIDKKDINDMVLDGLSGSEIQAIIDINTYNGLEGKLRLGEWKKI